MRCTEFLSQLDANLDLETRSAPPAAFLEHARICRRCREKWEESRLLDEAIAAWKQHAVELGVAESVPPTVASSKNEGKVAASRAHRTSVRRPLFAGAACLLAVIAVWFANREPGNDVRHPTLATETERDPVLQHEAVSVEAAPLPEKPEKALADNARADAPTPESAYLAMAWNATESVTNVVAMLVPEERGPGEVPPGDETPEWINQWGQTLRPIGQNVEQAFEKLLDSLPATPRTTDRRLASRAVA